MSPELVDCEGMGGRFSAHPSACFGEKCYFDTSGDITIEAGAAFGREVEIITHYHPDYSADGAPHEAVASPLVVCEGAFVGDRATILPQVSRIGRHAIVGAAAVVTKDVNDGEVVAGNPAKVIRMRSVCN